MAQQSGVNDSSKPSKVENLLTLDYNNLTSDAVGPENGLEAGDLTSLKGLLTAAAKDFNARRKKGLLPFADLPTDTEIPKACRKLADSGRKKYENVVVLGIGGSALGTSAVFKALRPLNHNIQEDKKRGWPRLFVADNIDPEGFLAILEETDLSKTLFNVISKSGATAETMSQFMIVHDRLRKSLGAEAIKEHLLITTDPENGVLRRLVQSQGLSALPIPPGVGGRFSVFTAVGLAPLAMAGVNITDLLAGAAKAVEDFAAPPMANKALLFAGLNYLMTTQKNRTNLVMMPYADSLSRVADWFGQLWNESLGKAELLDGTRAAIGQTAIKALGATDQHSQLQLYMEGPRDKTICFIGVDDFRNQIKIPAVFKDQGELSYLCGRGLGELLNFERLGTARALAENGRPSLSLTSPKLTSASLGYLMQTLMLSTVISGSLYRINPLNQPGVELGKKFTYGLMGRKSYEDMAERYHQGKINKKYIVP
ncbi:MAG: glucose-6-phosphate isomerase [Deltaproteobacteria bacterium]|jgi:glucose-6-phosphate isomerase|nr:glucose-6-phosphate isomerase [Deltaproteobacteria bacterium]